MAFFPRFKSPEISASGLPSGTSIESGISKTIAAQDPVSTLQPVNAEQKAIDEKTTDPETRIKIPDFLADWRTKPSWPSPYPPRRHAQSESIKAEAERWLRSYHRNDISNDGDGDNGGGSGISNTFISKIIAGDFPDIACLIYAHQDAKHTLLAALVMLHFFVIDEFTDTIEGNEEGEANVRRQSAALVRAFRDPDYPPLPPRDEDGAGTDKDVWVGIRMAADIASRYRSDSVGGTAESWAFFVDSFADYLDGVGDEVALRRRPCVPCRAEYMAVRRRTIGVLPGMALLLIDRAVRPGFFAIPAVDAMLRLCVDIIINQNDIYSFDKEQARGEDGHNGVRVLMEEEEKEAPGPGSVQEAMNRLGEETRVLVGRFVELCENLPTLEDEVDNAHLGILREGCVSWIVGMEVWSTLVTKRYGMQRLDGDRYYTATPRKKMQQQ
ncbi:hypothetical protein CORC01_10757 [Colletotrichum orchidophilum]|uniref:Terpene synthase n=1 Tax=Colletotrichum orchidophilum TaxID=1209926 RepID=A0A1G4AXT2_9PEZI|nr:uncharacterized protein CORC01_10757 [Colletotrichum orchidophilum]OHE93970.1 hypothetical protein CORC01_10757 [Colletotrichum orchidophilum]